MQSFCREAGESWFFLVQEELLSKNAFDNLTVYLTDSDHGTAFF